MGQGKQKGLRGHIQLSQELCLEMRGDCSCSWRLPAPRAGFGQVVAWLIGAGGRAGSPTHNGASKAGRQPCLHRARQTSTFCGGHGSKLGVISWAARSRSAVGSAIYLSSDCREELSPQRSWHATWPRRASASGGAPCGAGEILAVSRRKRAGYRS